jgi:hypothetical protein
MLIDFTNAIWSERNSIAHSTTNLHDLSMEATTDQRLSWYRLHYTTILSRHDFHLIDGIQEEKLFSAPLRTKRQWLKHLDAARDVFAVECAVRKRGQSCLTDFFPVVP